MATAKPISTISYNSEGFLKEKLDSWVSAHIIQAYQYIFHKGEDGDKDHIHLRLEPNKTLDPMDLLDQLREFQPGKIKPLCCRPFRPSVEEDWILYAIHDKTYLKLKYGGGEKGEKIPYTWQDIKVPDNYDMEVGFIRAKAKLEHTSANMAVRLQQGSSPLSLIMEGENVHTVNAIYRALSLTDYDRLQAAVADLTGRLDALIYAVNAFGLTICADENGKIFLKKSVDS